MKPYVLNEMNNHRGAVTQVTYRSSTEEYLRDQARPETRWRTPLPFPVQVVSQVVVIDEFSRGRLTTEYRYHHGYWDGGEREYRGFGYVEALNTETFEDYFDPSNHNGSFASVESIHYSPPTRTKSWFHLGPVVDEFGELEAVDHDDEYWPGDAPFFAEERNELQGFLAALDQRRDRGTPCAPCVAPCFEPNSTRSTAVRYKTVPTRSQNRSMVCAKRTRQRTKRSAAASSSHISVLNAPRNGNGETILSPRSATRMTTTNTDNPGVNCTSPAPEAGAISETMHG
jgi:hypothetical protein